MTPRRFALLALATVALLAVISACGGGGDDDDGGNAGTGQITDPRTVPTATPWTDAPDPIILDPDNLTPLSGGVGVGAPDDGDDGGDDGDGGNDGDGGDDGDAGPPPGECGNDTYVIESGDTISGIAAKCDLATQDILDANPGIDPQTLHVGDEINLP